MLKIDTNYFHEVCIYVLYAFLVLLLFVFIERIIYFTIMRARLSRARKCIGSYGQVITPLKLGYGGIHDEIAHYVSMQSEPIARSRIEDLSAALYIEMDSLISSRLWVLDTIVTAAPLLGLLGTILGIMDTFAALSAGGISDPGAVSRGISAALLATAIGIGTALIGLLGHNVLHRIADVILEEFKSFLLLSTRT
jgi:biopolymer transport protein ExbB